MKFIIELALETGMRRTEIANIKSEHIKGLMLNIPVAKTKPRTIPITKKAKQLLRDNLPIRMILRTHTFTILGVNLLDVSLLRRV